LGCTLRSWVQKSVVFFEIFSKKYVVSTYLANAQLTHPLYDGPHKPDKRQPTRERTPEKKGEEQMRAYYVKVFRHLLSTTVLTCFLGVSN
jgi:hypothetical protein